MKWFHMTETHTLKQLDLVLSPSSRSSDLGHTDLGLSILTCLSSLFCLSVYISVCKFYLACDFRLQKQQFKIKRISKKTHLPLNFLQHSCLLVPQ